MIKGRTMEVLLQVLGICHSKYLKPVNLQSSTSIQCQSFKFQHLHKLYGIKILVNIDTLKMKAISVENIKTSP